MDTVFFITIETLRHRVKTLIHNHLGLQMSRGILGSVRWHCLRLEDGSVVKSTCSSYRGPGLGPQSSHDSTQVPETLVSVDLMPLLASVGIKRRCDTETYMQAKYSNT